MATNRMPDPSIALIRAAYVFPYLEVIKQIGVPIDRELRRARLPVLIEETPRAYLSTDLVYRLLAHCIEREGIGDLGFRAGWALTFEDLGSELIAALLGAPTLKTAIESLDRLASREDSEFHCQLIPGDITSRVYIRQFVPPGEDSRLSEWQNVKVIIEMVRNYAGPDWVPSAIGLMSAAPVSQICRRQLGQTRILTGQPNTFLQFSSRLLAEPMKRQTGSYSRPDENRFAAQQVHHSFPDFDDFVARMRTVLFPYLSEGHPPIDLAAEIAGTSVRDLQRRLDRMQTSYSMIIESLRTEHALYLLQKTDLKVLDIALMLGYQDASNFARAVRRSTGLSPRQLRHFATTRVRLPTGTK